MRHSFIWITLVDCWVNQTDHFGSLDVSDVKTIQRVRVMEHHQKLDEDTIEDGLHPNKPINRFWDNKESIMTSYLVLAVTSNLSPTLSLWGSHIVKGSFKPKNEGVLPPPDWHRASLPFFQGDITEIVLVISPHWIWTGGCPYL
ncbi:hypothetical protein J6590_078867 [Homalodisca vitripennis]|nr:hypothetical protein J6590_078867 [Homalodisca vitripennis]